MKKRSMSKLHALIEASKSSNINLATMMRNERRSLSSEAFESRLFLLIAFWSMLTNVGAELGSESFDIVMF